MLQLEHLDTIQRACVFQNYIEIEQAYFKNEGEKHENN